MNALQKWMSDNSVRDDALAAKIGVSRVQVFRLRRGDHKPSVRTALALERETGIPAATLILGEVAA